ncbi:MAG: glycosyltransferase [Terracidiphilus sp.]|nr:glycosyltransferase [Terracidiphilus sp.]
MSRIALVIPGLDRIGGAERQLLLLARGLHRRGWRVSVVGLSGNGGDAAGELIATGIEFLSLRMRKGLADPRGWMHFNRWLRRERPDVVHAHLPHGAWFVRWSRLGAPVRVVVDRLHSASTGSLGRGLGYRLSGWLPDRVTAVSHAVADTHLAARMVSKDRLLVLPNGVDVDAWRPDASVRLAVRRELGIGNEFLWFAAGRLEAVKDYPTLLRAMGTVPEPARLVIAGGGPLQGELTQLCVSLGLERRVTFLGFAPDVRRWMQAADGFVLSSRWEGLPMGLLEAAACALPAVATDVAGTRETMMALSGKLTSAGDAAELGKAMSATMQTPLEERRRMGENARRQVVERFSLEAALDRWETLYADLLRHNPKPRRWAGQPHERPGLLTANSATAITGDPGCTGSDLLIL